MSGAVAQTQRYKDCFFFSPDFIGDNSWNGYEHNLVFENLSDGLYTDVARPLGCDEVKDSRGLAVADLDNDGKLDMVVANNDDPPTIYLNRMKSAGAWLGVSLVGSLPSNIDAVGARVRVTIDENGSPRKLCRWVEIGSGYCSQSDLRLHFGLGNSASIQALEVRWPDGSTEVFDQNHVRHVINSAFRIQQGTGKIESLQSRSNRSTSADLNRDATQGKHLPEVSSL